jgi:Transcriptional regulator
MIELMQEKEVQNITVTDICNRADLNRGTFYTYHQDVFSLVSEIENEILDEVTKILDNAAQSRLGNSKIKERNLMVRQILECFSRHRDVIKIVFGDRGYITFQQKLKSLFITKFSQIIGMSNTVFEDHDGYLAVYITSGMIGIIQEWIQTGFQKSPEEIANIMMDIKTRTRN